MRKLIVLVGIAGVIASSAGYPDSQPRATVPFAIFGTAGTEDFNYIEMRQLDRKLTSPHFLAVFNGGHMLPPDAVVGKLLKAGEKLVDSGSLLIGEKGTLLSPSDYGAQFRLTPEADFAKVQTTKPEKAAAE